MCFSGRVLEEEVAGAPAQPHRHWRPLWAPTKLLWREKRSSAVGDVLRDGPEIASLHWRGNTGGRRLFAGRYRPTAIKPLESIQNMTAQASSVASRPSMSR